MSEILIKGLNNEIHLSKKITNIPNDFYNGYLFAELLYRTRQIPSLKKFKNSSNTSDMINNFSLLDNYFTEIKSPLTENAKKKIMEKDLYTSIIYLHKIRQSISKKCINLNLLNLKYSNKIGKLYSTICYPNENKNILLNSKKEPKPQRIFKSYSCNKSILYNKTNTNLPLSNNIKKDFPHLQLTDFEVQCIVDNISDNKYKYDLIRKNILTEEKKQKDLNSLHEKRTIDCWTKSMIDIHQQKNLFIKEQKNKITYYQNSFLQNVKKDIKVFKRTATGFEAKINMFSSKKDETEATLIGKNKILMKEMREKLSEKIKNKKRKEKIERKRLKEEQEQFLLKLEQQKNISSYRGEKQNNNEKINSVYKTIPDEKENNDKDNVKKQVMQQTMSSLISASSYLTKSELGDKLINNSQFLHANDIGEKNQFFKTMSHFSDENKKELPEINLFDNYKLFDEKDFFDDLNRENYIKFNKKLEIKKNKKLNEQNLVLPILNQIIDLCNYLTDNEIKLKKEDFLENSRWDGLMNKFLIGEPFVKEKKNLHYFFKNKDAKKEEHEIEFRNKKYTERVYDYVNYIGLFNDLVIPLNSREEKFSFVDIYSDFYSPENNNNIDIHEYEPSKQELSNLIFPKYYNSENSKFTEVIQNILETEFPENKSNNISEEKDIFTLKGKYFYLPIKMSLIGYPMSGKEYQSELLMKKYPGIKIYDPKKILKSKIEEYNNIKKPVEKTPKFKSLKPNQIKELKAQKKAQLNEFKPILDIISPYVEKKDNEKIDEKIISDIYIKLIIHELNNDFKEDKETNITLLNDLKEKYSQYLEINSKIEEINSKLEKEVNTAKNKKNNPNALHKELTNLTKDLDPLKNSLFVGFILIDFPSNETEAKFLENHFTGYISEYEKPIPTLEQKKLNYDFILDSLNKIDESNNKNIPHIKQYSFLDLVINLDIDVEEFEKRCENAKFDPHTEIIYTESGHQIPANDKKLIGRLTSIPEKIKEEYLISKINYGNNSKLLIDFYKNMYNGLDIVYNNLNAMEEENNNLNENLNNNIDNIVMHYYQNIDIIISKINKTENHDTNNNNTNNNDTNNNNTNNNNTNNNNNNNNEVSESVSNSNSILNTLNNSNNNINTKKIISEIYSSFDKFAESYKLSLKLFCEFLSDQRVSIINYLNGKQDAFIEYLNRKTKTTEISQLFIEKYNTLSYKYNSIMKNDIVIKELSDDISQVKNSLWANIQYKKKEEVDFLKQIKEENNIKEQIENMWLFIENVFDIEIRKFLLYCEILVKYFLTKYTTIDITQETITFQIDYKKYFHEGLIEKDDTTNAETMIENNINILIKNSLKIIVAQDKLISDNFERLMNYIKNNNIINISALNKRKTLKANNYLSIFEELNEILNQEKNSLKYRLLFLKYFVKNYNAVLESCFNDTYDIMDKWIILNVSKQNSNLNEFIGYLERGLKNNFNSITLDNRNFDGNYISSELKLNIAAIFDRVHITDIIEFDDNFKKNKKFKLVNLNNLKYTELYCYDLEDFMLIYKSILNCSENISSISYIVKRNIVFQLFVKKYLYNRNYELIFEDKKNKNESSKSNNNIIINKGICKKLLILTNTQIQSFLNKFSLYEKKYINVKELFTTLLLIGSELISPVILWESLQNYIPENKKKENNILLNLDEFMNINFWFEKDEYLNFPVDHKENGIFAMIKEDCISVIKEVDSSKIINNVNNFNKDKIFKIKKIKEALFQIFSDDNLFDVKKFVSLFEKLNTKDNISHPFNISNMGNRLESFISTEYNLSGDKNAKSERENISVISEDSVSVKSVKKSKSRALKVQNYVSEIKNNIFEGLFTI